MTTYTVTLTVELDRLIDDATARDLAARWAAALRLDPGLTRVDGARLTVRGTCNVDDSAGRDPLSRTTRNAMAMLESVLTLEGGAILAVGWHAVEVVSAAEHARRDAAASLSATRG